MGCTQSRAIESPFLLGSLLETTQQDIFLGATPSVTLTTSLDNDTSHKVVYKGCYLRKGSQAPLRKFRSSVNSNSHENLILAAMNSEKFSEILRGTNGLALWKIEGTEYVMVMAWKIPKYRTVLKQSNTISFGLLLNRFGKFDHSSSINFELYQKIMKNGSKLKPNLNENFGNFVRMSCKNLTAGEEICGVLRNKNLQLTARLTSGRSARVHLTLTKNSKPVNALHRMGEAEILQSLMKAPSVSFITSLENNTCNGIEYQGCYLKRGYHLDTNDIAKEMKGFDSDNILAAINSKSSKLRGTNGVALWKLKNTEYVLILAWKIPKYRRLLNQTNTISFGMLLNTNGHYNHPSNINADLYKEVMKSPGRLAPRTFADCGNFAQMSCLETSSGGMTSMTFQNNRFKMVAQLTSGRSARCHLVLEAVKNPSPLPSPKVESRNIKLLAFKKCFCDSCEFENVPCDGSGNAVGLLIEDPSCTNEESMTYLGAGTAKEPNLHICSMKIEEFDLKGLLLHRLKCNRYHDQRYISTYNVGQIRIHPEDLNFCSESQNPITSQVYKSGQNHSVNWLVHQIKLLGIDKLYPHVLELLQMDLDRLINYRVEGVPVDHSKILAKHFEPVMETLSIQKMKPMPRPRWHIRPPWYKSSNVMLIEQMKTFLEKS